MRPSREPKVRGGEKSPPLNFVTDDGLSRGSTISTTLFGNLAGRREVLGMTIGASVAEAFWTEFLRSLARRGLRGVKLVISGGHKGLKAAARVLNATWQRCRVRFMRNLLAPAGKQDQRVAAAFLTTTFAQQNAAAAITRLIGAILREKNDEWADQTSRIMNQETIAPMSPDHLIKLLPAAA